MKSPGIIAQDTRKSADRKRSGCPLVGRRRVVTGCLMSHIERTPRATFRDPQPAGSDSPGVAGHLLGRGSSQVVFRLPPAIPKRNRAS